MSTTIAPNSELLPEVAAFLDASLLKAFVNGEWVEASGGQTFDVVDPGTGEKIRFIPEDPNIEVPVDGAIYIPDASINWQLEYESGNYRLRISATLSDWTFKIEELTREEAELYTPTRRNPLDGSK